MKLLRLRKQRKQPTAYSSSGKRFSYSGSSISSSKKIVPKHSFKLFVPVVNGSTGEKQGTLAFQSSPSRLQDAA